MTGSEFEQYLSVILYDNGYWALNIPRNRFGAQPFDIVAIKGSRILAIDCKVCSQPRFPLSRIEDNQWMAFDLIKKRTNAECYLACFYDNRIYWIPVNDAEYARELGKSSLPLSYTGEGWIL